MESALGKFLDGSDQKVSSTEVSTLPEPFLFSSMDIGGKVWHKTGSYDCEERRVEANLNSIHDLKKKPSQYLYVHGIYQQIP